MGDGVRGHQTAMTVAAPPAVVYDLLTDIERMSDWSPEVTRCQWVRGATGAQPGARFRGWSRKGWHRWSTMSTITEAERPSVFEFRVTFVGRPVATWRYTFDSTGSSDTRLSESVVDERRSVLRRVSPYITGSRDRTTRNAETMNVTLQRLKSAAEGRPPGS